jgi:branched-subunit amino acid transport protein
MNNFAVIVILSAIGTWGQRVIPWGLAVKAQMKEQMALERMEPFVHAFAPAIVLALLLSAIWTPQTLQWRSLIAVVGSSVATVLAARKFRTVGIGVLAGISTYWILQVR